MEQAPPMSAHRGSFVAVTVIAWVVIGLATLLFAAMIVSWLSFAHDATCGPHPPTEFRHQELLAFAVVQGVLVLGALGCIVGSRRITTIVALVLASVAAVVPFLSWAAMIFEVGMC